MGLDTLVQLTLGATYAGALVLYDQFAWVLFGEVEHAVAQLDRLGALGNILLLGGWHY